MVLALWADDTQGKCWNTLMYRRDGNPFADDQVWAVSSVAVHGQGRWSRLGHVSTGCLKASQFGRGFCQPSWWSRPLRGPADAAGLPGEATCPARRGPVARGGTRSAGHP